MSALAVLAAVLIASRTAIRVRSSGAAAAVSRMLIITRDGISLSRQVDAELGRLKVVVRRGRRRRSVARFEPDAPVPLGKVSYGDLCSGGYLLAVGPGGVGYLDAPAVRISAGPYKDTFVLCFDPQEVPRVTRPVELLEETSTVTGTVDVLDGGYVVRMSWAAYEIPSWKLVYDPQRRAHRIVREPGDKVRARAVRVDICVRLPEYPECEVCAAVGRLTRIDGEVSGRLEGVSGRRITAIHRNVIDLLALAEELEIARFPHVSGYSEGYVVARLTVEMPSGEEMRWEEPV